MKSKFTENDIFYHPWYGESMDISDIVINSIEGEYRYGLRPHLVYLVKEIMEDSCKYYLQIGVSFGHLMITAMQTNHPTRYVGIDDWSYHGDNFKYKDNFTYRDVTLKNIELMNENRHKYIILSGKSQDIIINKHIKSLYARGIDFLVISGDRSEKMVKSDFINYGEMVNKNGIIMFSMYDDPRCPFVRDAVEDVGLDGYDKVFERDNVLVIRKK